MLQFIQQIIENPKKFSEEEKLAMLQDADAKNISAQELAEIVRYIKSKQAIQANFPDSIDICGTGGSWLPRINTSTLACLKLAKKWIKISKHGNKASSGRFGSFDLLEELGYFVPRNTEETQEEYEKNNIAFLYAKNFFPFFKEFAEVRKRYSKPTIFNILWPLLNPSNSNHQIIGCSFEEKMPLMIETCQILGRKNVAIVRGNDGLDEITLSNSSRVYELKNEKIKHYEISPEDFSYTRVQPEQIFVENIQDKIRIAQEILAGKKSSYSDLVDINVDFALQFLKK